MQDTEVNLLSTLKENLQDFQKIVSADIAQRMKAHEAECTREIRQRTSRGPFGIGAGGDATATETRGQKFLASEQYKMFRSTNQRRSGQFVLETRALTAPTFPVPPVRLAADANVYPALTLRDLLAPVPMKVGGSIDYLRQKPTTGTAAVQWPQGSLKAQLTLDFELASANIATVAAYCKAARQILDDEQQLIGLIDSELTHQVGAAEEKEILSGDGSAGRMQGLLTLAPVFAGATGTSPIDNLGQAIGTLAASGYAVTGTLLNPLDWITLMQTKTTGTGEYLIGNPGQGATQPFLWNVPVATSPNIVEGTFLTGAFGTAAQIFDREERLEISLENEDDFVKNLATILGERRSALVYRRPAGFLQGSLVAAAGTAAKK